MDLEPKFSCDGFPTDSSSSSKSGVNFPGGGDKKEELEAQPSCSDIFSTSTSSSTSISTAVFKPEYRLHRPGQKDTPNVGYELAVAKAIMQQYSTLSGDNLFDHLSDIIKRVIDERPPNVIDFFEEFSRNVREQKFHLPERFPPDAIFDESRMYRVAKRQLLSMKLPCAEGHQEIGAGDEMSMEDAKSANIEDLKLEMDGSERRFNTFNERVQQLQFYWNQCGFSISSEDIFQLACAMDRLQHHPSILQCRFWGVISGMKHSYYIVEASLTREELNARLEQMQDEMRAKLPKMLDNESSKPPLPSHIGPELTPGINGWEHWPAEELAKMKPAAAPVPLVEFVELFDVPPEPIGYGVNRYSYFVVNALSDDWIELPILTPRQIITSRKIKKFLTGDLEAEIVSYPCFPGKEKHYLRALISRITAGTYIAPEFYYRKMTKREQRLFDGEEDDEMMEEEEEEEEPMMGEDEEEDYDNDKVLLKNEKYKPQPLHSLGAPASWVHVRPNILDQGRVVWYDEERARREREKERARMLRMLLADEIGEEEQEEEEEEEAEAEGEEEGMIEGFSQREIGPALLTHCNNDTSEEFTVPWIARYTSRFTNKNERVLVMHSNVWQGAYTFTFESVCESIYMGFGHKYCARNMPFTHLPPVPVEYPHGAEDFLETTDPSVEEEEAYRQYLLSKQKHPDDIGEQLDDEFDDHDGSTHDETEDED